MKIVGYDGADNISIQFEDGIVVHGKTYANFKRGSIRNPNFNYSPSRLIRMVKS